MNDTELDNLLALRLRVTEDIRKTASHYFLPAEKPADNNTFAQTEYSKKLAESHLAVELVCSLVNVFGVMLRSDIFSTEAAISDLTFSLNTNPFWVKNSSYLMPVLAIAVNGVLDAKKLRLKNEPLWSNLWYQSRNLWLEVLPAILFCLSGYAEMQKKSLEIKQSFEKFLRE